MKCGACGAEGKSRTTFPQYEPDMVAPAGWSSFSPCGYLCHTCTEKALAALNVVVLTPDQAEE